MSFDREYIGAPGKGFNGASKRSWHNVYYVQPSVENPLSHNTSRIVPPV